MADDFNRSEQGAPEAPGYSAAPGPAEVPGVPPQPQTGYQAPPPPQPAYGAPQPPAAQPAYGAPRPPVPGVAPAQGQPWYPPALMQLSGGMKFAWLVVGALLGIPGILIAWLVNIDRMPKVKDDAVKFSVIGFVVWIVIWVIFAIVMFGMVSFIVANASSSSGWGSHTPYSYGYGSW